MNTYDAAAAVDNMNKEKIAKTKKKIVAGIMIFAALLLGSNCIYTIPAGYAGVIYNINGGVDGEIVKQGVNLVAPTKDVTEYSISLEQSYLTSEDKGDSEEDESFFVPTSDGKTVKVDLEYSFKFDEARLPETFIMFKGRDGEQVKNEFIKPKIVAWSQEVTAKYPVTDIFGDKRTQINSELDVHLREKFDKYGIIIDTVNFTNISVDEETAAAIQKKVNAQQKFELTQIEAETAKIQANKEKEVAQIAAETAIVEAEAKAKAKLIEAEAEAKANMQLAASLTPTLVEKIKYEKWNGELPTVSGANALVSIDGQ